MERPKKYISLLLPEPYYYKDTDIDPLLDELERLKADKKPFPSFEEFEKWWDNMVVNGEYWYRELYTYFAQFQYETVVFPKVGDLIEGEDDSSTYRGKFKWIELDNGYAIWNNIRPASRPTREEVIAKYGLTDEELAVLGVSR